MEFKNLDCNILDLLGETCMRTGTSGPFKMNRIYREFSDIPEEYVTVAIMLLYKKGFLNIQEESQKLFLTPMGIAEIESLRRCLQDFPKRPQRQASGCCT